MIVSKKLKYVFLDVPKTGTRSLIKILVNKFDGIHKGDHTYNLLKNYKNYFIFMTIRNPYSRLISAWWSTTQRGKDKYGWIKKAKGKSDLKTIIKLFAKTKYKRKINHGNKQKIYYDVGVNQILRFEHLEEDFNSLPFVNKKVKLLKLNKTYNKRKPYYHYMTDDVIKMVNKYYKEDFEIGNYKMYKNKKEMLKDVK